MLNITRISSPVMRDLMDSCGAGTEDAYNQKREYQAKQRIARMDVEEAFDTWLKYQGIIGYTSPIMRTLKNIQEAEVK